MRFIFIAMFAMVLSSCGTMISFASWQERSDLSAPLLFDGKRGQAFWRCAIIPHAYSNGPCQLGFKNQNGDIVPLEEIEAEIDAYVPTLGISGPHEFFVLTYSPTVILYVPGKSRLGKQCGGANYTYGCFSTRKLFPTNFQYGPRPEVAIGSFVFAPAINSRPIHIPHESTTFEFALPDSTLKLSVDGHYWNVVRDRHK
jgi:hypothetical protein